MKRILFSALFLIVSFNGIVLGQNSSLVFSITGTITSIDQRATANTNNPGTAFIVLDIMPRTFNACNPSPQNGWTSYPDNIFVFGIYPSDASFKNLLATALIARAMAVPVTITYKAYGQSYSMYSLSGFNGYIYSIVY